MNASALIFYVYVIYYKLRLTTLRFNPVKMISKPDPTRACTIYPLHHPDVWDFYKRALAAFWTPAEIDLSEDRAHWLARLTEDERGFVRMVLAFFASADALVAENLTSRFMNDVQIPEVQYFYAFQAAMENIHAETYSLLIEALVTDPDQKSAVINSARDVPAVARKAAWVRRYMAPERPFAVRLVAFAAIEGVFFSGSFCALFWLKKRGLMPGLTFSNELIARDEGLHTEFACLLFSKFCQDADYDREIASIIREAVDIEREFVTAALPVRLIGMNADLMCQYIEYVADRLLTALGQPPEFGVQNPFEWMELISLEGKTNFFEKRVGEYQRADVKQGRPANETPQGLIDADQDF